MRSALSTLRGAFLDSRGSVAVEAALIIPVVFTLLWLFTGAAFTWRLEGAVHRATAAMADTLSNQRYAEDEALTDRLSREAESLGAMFIEMVTGEDSAEGELRMRTQYGVRVTYYNTYTGSMTTYDGIGSLTCASSQDLQELGSTGASGSLVTSNNYGTLQLVKVDACIRYTGMRIENVVFPREFSSTFIAARREE